MNIENLKALREFERGREIDMSRYMNECGTAGCPAGWECIRIYGHLPRLRFPWGVAKESLDLTAGEANFLFVDHSHLSTHYDCDRAEAEARLDYLIEHGRAPEDWQAWAERLAAEGAR